MQKEEIRQNRKMNKEGQKKRHSTKQRLRKTNDNQLKKKEQESLQYGNELYKRRRLKRKYQNNSNEDI